MKEKKLSKRIKKIIKDVGGERVEKNGHEKCKDKRKEQKERNFM